MLCAHRLTAVLSLVQLGDKSGSCQSDPANRTIALLITDRRVWPLRTAFQPGVFSLRLLVPRAAWIKRMCQPAKVRQPWYHRLISYLCLLCSCPECEANHIDIQALTWAKVREH